MKKEIKMAFTAILLLALIIIPVLRIPVYGAGTYTLHKVKNPTEYAKETEEGKMSFITNLSDISLDITDGNFTALYSREMKRTCILLDRSKIPKKDETKSWKNIASITFRNAGYTSEGVFFNLVYTLAGLEMTGVTDSAPPDDTELVVADVTDEAGIISRAGFGQKNGNGSLNGYAAKSTPYIQALWKFEVTDTKGKPLKVPPIVMLFKDIDTLHESGGGSQNEAIRVISGFGSDVYISDDSYLKVSEGNSLFEAGEKTENEDPRSQLLLIMKDSEASIQWHGLTCGTYITPTSVTGYPVPKNEKTVDRTSAEMGDTLRYTLICDFPVVSEDNAAMSITLTDTLNDILDAEQAVTHVFRGNEEVSSEWDLKAEGQTLSFGAKNPAQVQGVYTFTIDAGIRKDLVLDGRKELFIGKDGRLYYRIPNTDSLIIEDHNGGEITIVPDKTPETDIPVGGISLIKDVDRSRIEDAHAGEALKYSFTIRNTGQVSLKDVKLSDSLDVEKLVLDWAGSTNPASGEGRLLPGESVTGSASYTLKQKDIDSGKVHNTAGVTGTDPLGAVYTAEDTADTVLLTAPGIDLEKEALPIKKDAEAGNLIEYRFEMINTGNVTLKEVTFEDDHALKNLSWDKDYDVLRPGDRVRGSASYVITREDLDNGMVRNTASVTGKAPDGTRVTDTDDALTEIEIRPDILLEKSSDPAIRPDAHAGDTVPFFFEVTNTGNCSLRNFILQDTMTGISEVMIDWSTSTDDATGEGMLGSGESVRAKASYALTQTDIDSGRIVNTAEVTAEAPDGSSVSSSDEAIVRLTENAGIGLVKESAEEIGKNAVPGDKIHYLFKVTNTGNVNLTNVSIIDDLPGMSDIVYAWEGSSDPATPSGCLSPGEIVQASADYPLTQEDIDAGRVINEAKAVGRTPSGKDVVGTDDDTSVIPNLPAIELVKDVNRLTYENVKAGDTLKYTLTAANTGNCTLTGVAFEDGMKGFEKASYDWSGSSGKGIMKPGEIVKVSFEYSIEQGDIDKGSILNRALVSGTSPDHTTVTDEDDVTTSLSRYGSIEAEKEADTVKIMNAKPGDVIHYRMSAVNTGNVTLYNVELADEKEGLMKFAVDWGEASGEHVLKPGEKVTASAEYPITQEDIENESTLNTLTVTGRTQDGDTVGPEEITVTTMIARKDSLKVEKNADKSVIADARVGDTVNYTIRVTNDGNTVLSGIVLKDELPGVSEIVCDWSGASAGEDVLLPGESMTAAASYSIKQADIDRGSVVNTVQVTAVNKKGEPVGPKKDDAKTELGGKGSFTVTKTVDKATLTNASPGEILTYTVVGKNTGSVTLTEVSLKDTLRDVTAFTYDWSEASAGDGVLLPGESVLATCTYAVKQADISNGKVENTVFMSAKQPGGKTTEKDAKVTTVLKRDPTPTPTPVRVTGNTANSSGTSSGSRTNASASPSQDGKTVAAKTSPVKTGDDTHAEFWILLGIFALAVGLVKMKRGREEPDTGNLR